MIQIIFLSAWHMRQNDFCVLFIFFSWVFNKWVSLWHFIASYHICTHTYSHSYTNTHTHTRQHLYFHLSPLFKSSSLSFSFLGNFHLPHSFLSACVLWFYRFHSFLVHLRDAWCLWSSFSCFRAAIFWNSFFFSYFFILIKPFLLQCTY